MAAHDTTLSPNERDLESPTSNRAQPLSIKKAVYFIMSWNTELSDKSMAFDKEVLWKLTHRVSSLIQKPVNPESVARYRRRYWSEVIQ